MKQLILLLPAFLLFACSTPNEPEVDRELLCGIDADLEECLLAFPNEDWGQHEKLCADLTRVFDEKYGENGTASDEEKIRYNMYECK